MRNITLLTKTVALALVSIMTAVSCTKSRDAEFPSGAGLNLLTIKDYDGKTFDIVTGDAIEGSVRNASKAEVLDAKAASIGVNDFAVVKYTVADELGKKLLGNTAIVGRPNSKYSGLIRVEENNVKVFKVGKVEDIPSEERTYAETLSDKRLAVPIIGYPVAGLYTIERARNDRGETTTSLYEKSEPKLASATHFRIDFSRSEVFAPVVKADVFPAKFFDGEWFFLETITSAPDENSEAIGMQEYTDGIHPSTRVKFVISENDLNVVNLNIDERLREDKSLNFKKEVEIPATWKAYRVSNEGRGLREEEDSKLHWSKRPFIQLDFDKVKTERHDGRATLVSLELTEDYFSFTIQRKDDNIRYKYAFMRVKDTGYKAKRYLKDDFKAFGFFDTNKAVVENFEISRKEDLDKVRFISRFNRANGKIVYHFTKTTPAWIRPHVRKAVEAWDETFQKAGTGMRIILDESFDVELGDVRYNAMNIIETLTTGGLFGYGPSITDPMSGEIISATTNVHVSAVRNSLIEEIRFYVLMKIGRLEEGKIAGIASQLDALKSVKMSMTADGVMNIESPFATAAQPNEMILPADREGKSFKKFRVVSKPVTGLRQHGFDVSQSSGNIHEEIEKNCPEVVAYVTDLKGKNNATVADGEIAMLESCSKKLVVTKFLGTLVHEMGHNFGLRHNFMASNDVPNFWPKEASGTEDVVRSSSCMEYPAFNEDRLVKPGPYDVAAIRFGYADQVETADGKIIDLDVTKSVKANAEEKRVQRRPYKFCTDEDEYYSIDPMCKKHDAGVTPLEVVKNVIAEYQADVQVRNYRIDRKNSPLPGRLQTYRAQRFFAPLARIYQEWRHQIARYKGQDDQYLERLSAEDFAKVIADMKADAKFGPLAKSYEPAANAIFDFFFNVVNMGNRYCVANRKGSDSIVLIELEKARQQLFFAEGAVVTNCVEAKKYFDANGLEVRTELGHELNTFRYDLSPEATTEPNDVIGTIGDRFNAIGFLTARMSLSALARSQGFEPSFMDEPAFRTRLKAAAIERLLKGVSGKSLAQELRADAPADIKEMMPKRVFPMFSKEKDLVMGLLTSSIEGMMIPEKADASMTRLSTMRGLLTRDLSEELQKRAVDVAELPGGIFFVVTNQNAVDALAVVRTYKGLNAIREAQLIDTTVAEVATLFAKLKEVIPSDKDLATFKIEDAAKIVADLEDEITAAGKKVPSVGEVIGDLMIAAQLAEAISKQPEEVQAQFKDKSANEIFKQLQGREFRLTKEKIDGMIKTNNDRAAYYRDNRAELDVQMDLLNQTLRALGSL